MRKSKNFFSCVLILILVCLLLTGCVITEDMLANKWLTVNSAIGYLYDENQNIDNEVDAKNRGLTTETISDESQWNTPFLRYSEIRLDVQFTGKMLGLAFELSTNIASGFDINVEAQIYKQVELPETWDDLTDEEKIKWEHENCIQDRQYGKTTVTDRADVFFNFNATKTDVDTSYQIRIIFTAIDGQDVADNSNYLKNFMVDNFIVNLEV